MMAAARRGAAAAALLPFACSLLLQRAAALSLAEGRGTAEARAATAARAEKNQKAGQAGIWGSVPPSWFSGDPMESSHDGNAAPAVGSSSAEAGWTPPFRHPGDGTRSQVKSPRWFHESGSGGPKQAWQTHYPEVKGEFHHSQPWQVLGYQQWEYTPEGWLNDPKPEWLLEKLRHQPGTKEADWFDTAAGRSDIYGRGAPPPEGTARWLMAQPEEPAGNRWVERAVNTTISCPTPGCNGSSSLQAYDPATEEARLCRLNIAVHPTDFDDDFSTEPVDTWVVNGYSVRSKCDPMARGCNGTAWRPLYSCLREMDVDRVVDPERGSMVVEGRLNRMVDECPYNGNYLSAVAVVTCLVREIPARYAASHGVPLAPLSAPLGSQAPRLLEPLTVVAELACDSPGCQNKTTFYVDPTIAFNGGTCAMDVVLAQTDFDDKTFGSESVEFVALRGLGNLTTGRVFPGRNPCNEEYSGLKVPPGHWNYTLAQGVNITEQVLSGEVGLVGTLQLEGKISDMVDECGRDGRWLLHATAQVTCTPPPGMAAPTPAAEEDAAATAPVGPIGSQDHEGLEAPGHVLAKKLRERAALVSSSRQSPRGGA